MKKITFYSLLVFFPLFLFVVFSANAVKNENKNKQIGQEHSLKATDSALRQPTNTTKCLQITTSVNKKINEYNLSADHPRLLILQTKLAALITKLKTEGYNTSKLEADLATLKTKTNTCKTAYGQFIAKLGATKNFACGQSQEQFRTALQAGKAQMVIAQTACKDARTFINTVIKLDLKALKEKVKTDRRLSPKPTKEPSPSISPNL